MERGSEGRRQVENWKKEERKRAQYKQLESSERAGLGCFSFMSMLTFLKAYKVEKRDSCDEPL